MGLNFHLILMWLSVSVQYVTVHITYLITWATLFGPNQWPRGRPRSTPCRAEQECGNITGYLATLLTNQSSAGNSHWYWCLKIVTESENERNAININKPPYKMITELWKLWTMDLVNRALKTLPSYILGHILWVTISNLNNIIKWRVPVAKKKLVKIKTLLHLSDCPQTSHNIPARDAEH